MTKISGTILVIAFLIATASHVHGRNVRPNEDRWILENRVGSSAPEKAIKTPRNNALLHERFESLLDGDEGGRGHHSLRSIPTCKAQRITGVRSRPADTA